MAFPDFARAALIGAGLCLAAAAALAEETPQRGGTLIFGVAAEPGTYDCHATASFSVLHYVAPSYSTLLRFEPGNYPNIIGDVAESWTVSPDNLVYTFKLRPNVVFHDGSPLTAEDVKASYDRLRSPPQGVASVRQFTFDKIAAIDTPDPLTLVFRLKEVDAGILSTLASPFNCLYSAAKLREDPNWPATHVMGTGPFKFVEHVAGSHWNGIRFERYFRPDRPYLDGFRAVTTSGARLVNALAGKQIMAEFRGFSPPERDRLVQALGKDAKVEEGGWLLPMILAFNATKKPYDDPRVRRALSLAIDRWSAAKNLGRISPMAIVGGIVRPGGPWSLGEAEMTRWPGWGKDIAASRAEAKRLLHEAGADNLTIAVKTRNIEPYVTAGVFLIDQWRQLGLKVESQNLESAAYFNAIYTANFEVVIDSLTDHSDDPVTMLARYVSTKKSPLDISQVTDPTLDELYDKQGRTVDPVERAKTIHEFETRALEQAYSVPILWWHRSVVMNARVHGWTMSPSHMLYQDLGDVWLAKE